MSWAAFLRCKIPATALFDVRLGGAPNTADQKFCAEHPSNVCCTYSGLELAVIESFAHDRDCLKLGNSQHRWILSLRKFFWLST
jgi:hypothetical protein